MAEDKATAVSQITSSGNQDSDQHVHEGPITPKHYKKDVKKYVSFRSDEEDSSEVEVDESAK